MKAIFFTIGVDINFQLDSFMNGHQALELIDSVYEYGYRYSFIFTDFSMPEMDGVEFVKLVRKMLTNKFRIPLENQPIIIGITGHAEPEFQ